MKNRRHIPPDQGASRILDSRMRGDDISESGNITRMEHTGFGLLHSGYWAGDLPTAAILQA